MEYLILSWDDVYNLTLQISERIVQSGFMPDIIVGIARGGWIPARILSDVLYANAMFNVRIEYYSDIGLSGGEPKITQPLSVSIEDKNILIVDEVSDSGDSLTAAFKYLEDLGAKSIRTAVLHLKPWSKFTPDFYVQKVEKWTVYPWEQRESIISLVKIFKEQQPKLDMKQIREKLVFEVGFDPTVADYFIKRL
ncbi:MAG: phosphoribosyltransferase [Candidatus Thorarchaeota archaeon]|jgi:hypoxanthine phosphoribosyltransferase